VQLRSEGDDDVIGQTELAEEPVVVAAAVPLQTAGRCPWTAVGSRDGVARRLLNLSVRELARTGVPEADALDSCQRLSWVVDRSAWENAVGDGQRRH